MKVKLVSTILMILLSFSCSVSRSNEEIINEILDSNIIKNELSSQYCLISNINVDELLPLKKSYEIMDYELKNNEGWWAVIDLEKYSIVLYQKADLLLGNFSLYDDFLVLDQGTGLERHLSVYGLKNKYFIELDAYGQVPILINSKKNKIAINVKTNNTFVEGIDNFSKARIGIKVIDISTNKIDEYYPQLDTNFILSNFDNYLVYTNNEKVIEIKY